MDVIKCWKVYFMLTILHIAFSQTVKSSLSMEKYTCFNTVFDIACADAEIIIFDTARYGRNNSEIATKCKTPFHRNCDVDVHFTLNKLCAGKKTCSVAVNTALFGDPCGYEEFLHVSYRCVEVSSIHHSCRTEDPPVQFDHGYLASPNYPGKYYMDAECIWMIAVQPRQTIKMTIFDFELDVKKAGKCNDFLDIRTKRTAIFKDCGSLGKQVLHIETNEATVRFKTGQSSLTQRGFFVYFEGVGPGCPNLTEPPHTKLVYAMETDELVANVTCYPGYYFEGTDRAFKKLRCMGHFWNGLVGDCVAILPTVIPKTSLTTETNSMASSTGIAKSGTIIGIALGVISAVLLITLLLVLSLYLHRRRKNAERKLDQWRVVINNLQENAMNDISVSMEDNHYCKTPGTCSDVIKAKRKKNKNQDDQMQTRNLLSTHIDDENDEPMDNRDIETALKYAGQEMECKTCYSRRGSYSGRPKYYMAVSREAELDQESPYEYLGNTEPARPRVPRRHKRAKSGTQETLFKDCASQDTVRLPGKRIITQSAPDILELLAREDLKNQQNRALPPSPFPTTARGKHPGITRSSTLGHVQSHRSTKNLGSRSNSRGRISQVRV